MNTTDLVARTRSSGGVEIVRSGRMPWGESMVKHRQPGAMRHKRLFDGEEGAADNYHLAYADERSEYYSPSHRHLWDQIRYCAVGSVPIGRNMHVGPGEVAYFPEGVRYGPQEGGPDRKVLVLQFGGWSRNGYLSPEQIDRGREELAHAGSFEGGLFRPDADRDGSGRLQQDAYEAVWEHVTGAPAVYPEATVEAPIVMRPGAYPSVAVAPGARVRRLGTFEPRRVSIDVYDLDVDAILELRCDDGVLLGWIIDGEGVVGGEPVEPETAVRLCAHTADDLRAADPLTLLVVHLPALT